jgi:hypothetical protein
LFPDVRFFGRRNLVNPLDGIFQSSLALSVQYGTDKTAD